MNRYQEYEETVKKNNKNIEKNILDGDVSMSFEEEFPSFKGVPVDIMTREYAQRTDWVVGKPLPDIDFNTKDFTVPLKAVKRGTIDKQRVKEVLKMHWEDISYGVSVDSNFEEIFEKLGLEDYGLSSEDEE